MLTTSATTATAALTTTSTMAPLHELFGLPPSPEWTAALASIAAVAAATAAVVVARSARRIAGLQLFANMSERFSSPQVLTARRTFAESWFDETLNHQAGAEVMNFFEGLALLIEQKCVSKEVVWSWFGAWAGEYWYAFEPLAQDRRQLDPRAWEGTETLVRKLGSKPDLERLRTFFSLEVDEANRALGPVDRAADTPART